MKRLFISLAAISFATSALAAFPIGTNPAGSFVIGATGAYLRPMITGGNLNYNLGQVTAANADAFLYNLTPGYDWAWGAHLSYFAPNGVNDLTLRYFHVRNDRDRSAPDVATTGAYFSNNASIKVDQVDLIGGQSIPINSCLNLHPFFGLRWAALKKIFYVTDYTGDNEYLLTSEVSKFMGIGPNIGMSANYFLTPHFSLIGRFATSLLVGEINPYLTSASTELDGGAVHSFTNKNKEHRLVPNIDVKLGADYTYKFNRSALSVELGWKFLQYFQVFDSIETDGLTVLPINIIDLSSANLSLQGPYAEISVAF